MSKDKEIALSEITAYLSKTTFFANLDKSRLKDLANLCQIIQLKKNDILFHQGETSDGFYILVEGRLAALLEKDDSEKGVGVIHAGETVGELGGFSKKPRALTIKALFDSTLIWLTHDNISHFLDRYTTPDMFMEIVSTIINRSQSVIKQLGKERQNRHCAIIPATNDPIPDEFLNGLKKHLVKNHSILIVDLEDIGTDSGLVLLEKLKLLKEKADIENKTILFVIKTLDRLKIYLNYYKQSEGLDIFHRVEGIYAITVSNSTEKLSHELITLFDEAFLPFVEHKELVLWYGDSNRLPFRTERWLKQANFRLHHHIRNRKEDFLRFYRFILGKANALVLGGGGARGWASLGVVKALIEKEISVDTVCGASSGSFLSSAYAHTLDMDESHKMIQPLINMMGVFKLKQLSYPIISINNGSVFTKTLKSVFEPLKVEDLWLFNFSIASNLSTYQEEVQRRGPLWEAVRCSGSLPIIFPPLVRDGELIIDGGLLNNLPVDQMQYIIGPSNFIIAVNLSDFSAGQKYDFPPVVGFWDAIKNLLGLTKQPYSYPPFIESILKSLMLGSSYRVLDNARKANLLIDFNLSDVPLTNYPPEKVDILIERGYQETLPYLKDIKIDKTTGIIQK